MLQVTKYSSLGFSVSCASQWDVTIRTIYLPVKAIKMAGYSSETPSWYTVSLVLLGSCNACCASCPVHFVFQAMDC